MIRPQLLSTRFEEALIFASRLHAKQTRKNSSIPYIAHLLGVTALVLEAGGNEDEAIAALLHDAVEDQGGRKTLFKIRNQFGEAVASIVEHCTDAFTSPKPPWQQRKETYIANIPNTPPEARRVSVADKLHNARTILRDLQTHGENTWAKFNGGKTGTLWYYRAIADAYKTLDDSYLIRELDRVVSQIEHHAELPEEIKSQTNLFS